MFDWLKGLLFGFQLDDLEDLNFISREEHIRELHELHRQMSKCLIAKEEANLELEAENQHLLSLLKEMEEKHR